MITQLIAYLTMFLVVAFLLYVVGIKMYWSGKFAIYRLVDFIRSRKNRQ